MAASTHSLHLLLLLLLAVATAFCVLHAEAQTAPAPAPSGPLNFTGILDKASQFTTFLRLLAQTQVATQIQSQLNSTTEGLTVLAPTDNAFTNLKSGTLNDLSAQQQVQLVLYHVLPKYYTLTSLLTVSNPVRTQSSPTNGGSYGLNFTGSGGNQVNVTSGEVTTQINNALRQQFPLAVYQLDKVLLPDDMFSEKAAAPSPAKTPAAKTNTTKGTEAADVPSADEASGSSTTSVGFVGLALGLALLFMGTS